jgi:hypothetical protein
MPKSEAAAFVLIKGMKHGVLYLRYTDAVLQVVVSIAISNMFSIHVINL